jgi:hypothetical protein
LRKKLPDFELLEPLRTIEFNPDSRYLMVARVRERLSAEVSARIFARLKYALSQLLGEIKFSVVVLDGDIELDFYQFKERTDG